MLNETMKGKELHLVIVTPSGPQIGSETQIWVAATRRSDAVAAVLAAVPEGWRAELSNDILSPDVASKVRLAPGQVSELSQTL